MIEALCIEIATSRAAASRAATCRAAACRATALFRGLLVNARLQLREALEANVGGHGTGMFLRAGIDMRLRHEEHVNALDIGRRELVPLVGGGRRHAYLECAQTYEVNTVGVAQRGTDLADKSGEDGFHVCLVHRTLLLYAVRKLVVGDSTDILNTTKPLALGRAVFPVTLINLVIDCHNSKVLRHDRNNYQDLQDWRALALAPLSFQSCLVNKLLIHIAKIDNYNLLHKSFPLIYVNCLTKHSPHNNTYPVHCFNIVLAPHANNWYSVFE